MEMTPEFDPSKLDELKDYKDENNKDLRISIAEVYVAESLKLIEDLKKSSDDKAFSEIAHSLKSSTAAVGGMKLSQLFAYMEQNKLSPFEKAKALKEVEVLFSNLQASLKTYLKRVA